MAKILVTGAAGFIGSQLCDALLARGHEVMGYDNLCAGKMENLKGALKSKRFRFVRADILDEKKIADACTEVQTIYHLAADPVVKDSAERPGRSFEQNVAGTFRVLEAARKRGVKHFVLTSTSTVYGDAKEIPTPESAPLEPISNYGASKLAGEHYCASYAHTYGIRATAFRYANIFGERSGHGVMCDFYAKLRANPRELEILGDGKQDKSYLHVEDCIEASLLAVAKQRTVFEAYNIGSRKKYTVDELARIICKIMGVKPKFSYTGGKRGWVGDVPLMLLSTKKIEKLGWREKIGFEDGVRRYLKWLAAEGN
ncbi:MAG: GDP-mannose 4,6-dehydratase [Candidatus Burarchaeum sp.]|nr:NAD-dependent epimerase/dehydratase family protein [Candidatus Burarchaeum sp.]MDO8340098.1 GDP-mannose 4,6-dehydratase [Candidatus Burarchaeum sp.]